MPSLKKSLWLALAAVLLLVAHLFVVLSLTKNNLSALFNDLSIEQLGAYGDSIAPLTAFFAALAALYAILAYSAQQKMIAHAESERRTRERAERKARFDALYFKAVEEHDAALSRLSRAAKGVATRSTAIKLFKELRERSERGDSYDTPKREFWKRQLSEARFHPMKRFVQTFYAIVSWLDMVSERTNQSDWMELFMTRMSLNERRLMLLLLSEHAPEVVRQAARRLGILGNSEPSPAA